MRGPTTARAATSRIDRWGPQGKPFPRRHYSPTPVVSAHGVNLSATRRVFLSPRVDATWAHGHYGSSYRRGRWRRTDIAEILVGCQLATPPYPPQQQIADPSAMPACAPFPPPLHHAIHHRCVPCGRVPCRRRFVASRSPRLALESSECRTVVVLLTTWVLGMLGVRELLTGPLHRLASTADRRLIVMSCSSPRNCSSLIRYHTRLV